MIYTVCTLYTYGPNENHLSMIFNYVV